MKPICTVLTFIGLICTLPAIADTPTADQILEKCLASYDDAKTYQGETTLLLEHGGQHSKFVITVKAENDGKGMVKRSSGTYSTSDTESDKTKTMVQLFFDDGTTAFYVNSDKKQYFPKHPHVPEKVSALFRKTLDNSRKIAGKLSVSLTSLQDRPVYKLTSQFTDGTFKLYIDKQTFQLISLRFLVGKDANKKVAEFTVTNQVFDRPLATGDFTWSPPPGYREIEETEPPIP